MKPLKASISITLDQPVIEIIRRMAEEDDRSFSQFVNMILKDYIQAHPETDRT